ncbi:MAG: glycosyltransferase family 39 protein [Candidatus Aenigmatarchaeota archaeon]|nr:MAG: glycosyltransferase family 39 protein [Candidatus Aenigmarchaeota archaeon]
MKLGWDHAFLLVVVLSAAYSTSFLFVNEGMWWDEAVYLGLSHGLMEGHYSLYSGTSVESFRQPLLPLVLAALGIDTVFPSRVVVLLFGLATIPLVYLAGRRVYGRTEGLMAAAVFASFSQFLFFQSKTLTEPLFTFFFALSLLFLYGHKKIAHPFLAGVATGLAFMARYPGGILFPIYALWLLKKSGPRSAAAFVSGSLVGLIPLFLLGTAYYGNPFGGLMTSLTIVTGLQPDPWYFYAARAAETFGPLALAVLAGATLEVTRRRPSLFLTICAVAVLTLSLQTHKEVRFLVAFFPAFALVAASWWRLAPNNRQFIALGVVAMCALSLSAANDRVAGDFDGGKALREAAEYLKTLPEGAILSEYYSSAYPPGGERAINKSVYAVNPWIEVLAGKEVLVFPKDPAHLSEITARYALIYDFEPVVPEYAAAYAREHYAKLRSFSQWGKPEAVVVYEIQGSR